MLTGPFSETLAAENLRLRRRLASCVYAEAAKLTRTQERILRVLIADAPGIVSRREIRARTYLGEQMPHTETNAVDVQICFMRRKLNPLGVIIVKHYNKGYSVDLPGDALEMEV